MHLVFTLQNKQRIEGVVLAGVRRRIRLAVPGKIDALDLLCDEDGQWTTEYGISPVLDSIIGFVDDGATDFVATLCQNVLMARR